MEEKLFVTDLVLQERRIISERIVYRKSEDQLETHRKSDLLYAIERAPNTVADYTPTPPLFSDKNPQAESIRRSEQSQCPNFAQTCSLESDGQQKVFSHPIYPRVRIVQQHSNSFDY